MVNGPASGGEFPLGKEYWEQEAKKEGFVPTKKIKIDIGQQPGEMKYELKNELKNIDVNKLLKQAQADKKNLEKYMQKNGEYISTVQTGNSLKAAKAASKSGTANAEETLAKIISKIPAEDMINLTSQKAILNYIKAHPELKEMVKAEEAASAKGKVPDLTTQKNYDGTTEYFMKDPDRGEDGWIKISKDQYFAYREQLEGNTSTTEPQVSDNDVTEEAPYEKPETTRKLPDITKEVDENGVTHYYKKDPNVGESGWTEIKQIEYDEIRARWEGEV